MAITGKKSEKSVSNLASGTHLHSKEPFLQRETQARSRIRCVRLVPLDTNEPEHLAGVLSTGNDLICRPSGQSGLICTKRETFPINDAIGWVLQVGVMSSSAVICAGVILLLAHPANLSSVLLVFPHTPGEIWSGILTLQAQAFVALGLLMLIATPVIRVAASILAFALEKDRRYMAITTIVLVILLVGFLLGKGGG